MISLFSHITCSQPLSLHPASGHTSWKIMRAYDAAARFGFLISPSGPSSFLPLLGRVFPEGAAVILRPLKRERHDWEQNLPLPYRPSCISSQFSHTFGIPTRSFPRDFFRVGALCMGLSCIGPPCMDPPPCIPPLYIGPLCMGPLCTLWCSKSGVWFSASTAYTEERPGILLSACLAYGEPLLMTTSVWEGCEGWMECER